MSLRQLIALGVLAGAGYVIYSAFNGGGLPMVTAPTGSQNNDPYSAFHNVLAQVESNAQPYVKAKTSTASGLYQFTKNTWVSLGGQWGPDPTKAFGGLRPSIAEQTARILKLTSQNAAILTAAGIGLTNAALYAAHFLGAGTAKTVLKAAPTAPIASLVSPSVITANPFLRSMSVSDFMAWLHRKVG